MTRPIAFSGRPGATALMPRIMASWVRSTSSRDSSSTFPARNVAFVSPCTPPMNAVMSMLTMSPSRDHRVVGDAVADDLVQRGAQRLRVAAVAERGGVGAVADQEVVPDLVQEVGGHAGRDVPADLLERLGGEPARHPHPRDRLGVLDVGLAQRRALLADVLGAFDVRGTCRAGKAGPGGARWPCSASLVCMAQSDEARPTSSGGSARSTTRSSRADTPCPGKDLLGPYATREEAAHALEKVKERNEEWDAQD